MDRGADSSTIQLSLPQHDAERRAPEVERAEIDVDPARVHPRVVVEIPEVTDVATQPDVIGQEAQPSAVALVSEPWHPPDQPGAHRHPR